VSETVLYNGPCAGLGFVIAMMCVVERRAPNFPPLR
jgi:hypothetical protein